MDTGRSSTIDSVRQLSSYAESIQTEEENDWKPEMILKFYYDDKGERVYTLKETAPDGTPTESAHPARFSPDDKFSKYRLIQKKRFGMLPTQQPMPEY